MAGGDHIKSMPFAIRMASDVANATPSIQGKAISPLEKFSSVTVAPKVAHMHTFGSPVCTLDARLQQGKRVEKWTNRSRIGVCLGSSPRHSRKVALALSLKTGHVSPQFHCQFDDLFETRRPSSGNPSVRSRWQMETGFTDGGQLQAIATADDISQSLLEITDPQMEETDTSADMPQLVTAAENDLERRRAPQASGAIAEDGDNRRRSSRQRIRTSVMQDCIDQEALPLHSLHVSWDVFHDQANDIEDEMRDPISFALAASSNPDILCLNEAMDTEDSEQFRRAMMEEVDSHTDHEHWEVIKRKDVPHDQKVLPAVWAFRRKRRIATQEVCKWKARLNLHGGRQFYVTHWNLKRAHNPTTNND